MLQQAVALGRQRARELSVGLARSADDILEAQRLRWRVFADEMGARLDTRRPGVDQDLFDAYCEHLIVRDEAEGKIVGTYRILNPQAARRVGCYYAEAEFDLTRLQHLRPGLVEVGRSCIDMDYRSGAVIALLWSGLARYMTERNYGYLMGCASISMADGGHNASGVFAQLASAPAGALSPLEYRVFPRHRFPLERIAPQPQAMMPPLIKGYLRAGAWVCSEPAWDPDFNTADLPMMMRIQDLPSRYRKHFLGA